MEVQCRGAVFVPGAQNSSDWEESLGVLEELVLLVGN